MWPFKRKYCPNCQMKKTIPDGCVIQVCSKCQKQGIDYEMFKLPTGERFLICYVNAEKKMT